MFILTDIKDMARVLGYVMKPGAHVHSFCSALKFSLWYKTLALAKRELRASTRDYSEQSDTDNEKKRHRSAAGI